MNPKPDQSKKSGEYRPRHKDVVRYDGYGHCRDGVAIVEWDKSAKKHRYVDTYWSGSPTVIERVELPELLFNLSDVDKVNEWEWHRYDKSDRYSLGSEHGYRPSYYVRKGSEPSLSQQIQNAREKQEEARLSLDAAINKYRYTTETLAKLEATDEV